MTAEKRKKPGAVGMTGTGKKPGAEGMTDAKHMNLQEALDVARAAAVIAVPLIRDGLGTIRAGEAEAKSGPADLVTAVDRAVETAVVALLRERTPGVPVLGEEGGRTGPAASRLLWVLDPLDGTNNFAHGVPLNCFCLALLDDGRPVAGIVADPHRGELFTAVRGGGAWLESGGAWLESGGARRRLHIEGRGPTMTENPEAPTAAPEAGSATHTELSPLAGGLTLLEVGGGWPFAHFHRVWASLAKGGSAVRVLGSAGLSLAWLAAGRATALAFGRMQPWDIGAGVLLIEEAGGHVTGWDGPADVLAGSPLLAAPTAASLAWLRSRVRDRTSVAVLRPEH